MGQDASTPATGYYPQWINMPNLDSWNQFIRLGAPVRAQSVRAWPARTVVPAAPRKSLRFQRQVPSLQRMEDTV